MKGGFGGGGVPNMNNLMKQAKKMQADMMKAQAELEEKSFTAVSGGGAVSVTVSGKRQVTEIVIKPEVVDSDDVEMLQDLVMVAMNDALKQVDEATEGSMGGLTGGLF
jgi:hypothetical protein